MDPASDSVCDDKPFVCDSVCSVCYEELEDSLEASVPLEEWFTPDSPPFDFDQAMQLALSDTDWTPCPSNHDPQTVKIKD